MGLMFLLVNCGMQNSIYSYFFSDSIVQCLLSAPELPLLSMSFMRKSHFLSIPMPLVSLTNMLYDSSLCLLSE